MAYVLSTLCRQREDSYLYASPDVWPPAIFILYIINNLLNIAWLFLFDRFLINWALPVLMLTPATLYGCIFLSARRLTALTGAFKELNLRTDIWLIRIFVHNGCCYLRYVDHHCCSPEPGHGVDLHREASYGHLLYSGAGYPQPRAHLLVLHRHLPTG